MANVQINLTDELIDSIVVKQLQECRSVFLSDLGQNNSVFAWDDPEEDDKEIQKHIDALDIILNWFATPAQLKEIYGDNTNV